MGSRTSCAIIWPADEDEKFPDIINANKGTIFTSQVQEFEQEGLLIMGTNFSPPYLATALAHLDNNQFNKYFGMKLHQSNRNLDSRTA